ncbi:hypothetical protein JYK04_07118 [Streptomyces nojiriensis]|nr:hypothetical protein JYK04_07118 [Streptomyces nojiriensis]
MGNALGKPIPERDAAVQPYVEEGILLNLTNHATRTSDVSLQPFTTNFLTLHTEGSARPARRQPRYVLLMCCAQGNSGTARTVLVPMAMVRRRLSPGDADLLARVRYRRGQDVPPLLRNVAGEEVFSFRDFHTEPLAWVLDGETEEALLVNPALRRLLVALYTSDGALAVEWRRGMLLAIDNHRYFHGRTVSDDRSPLNPRHLKRLRLLARG